MIKIEIDRMIYKEKAKKHSNDNKRISIYSKNINHEKKKKKSKILNPNIRKTRKKLANNIEKKTDSKFPLQNEKIVKLNLKKQTKKVKKKPKTHQYYDCEINSFSYENARKYDKRTFYQCYISLIKAKHPIIFSFVPIKDYNSMVVKISLFLILFSIIYITNALFFNESVIHRIYLDKGEYNYAFFIPKLFLYFLLSHIIYTPIKYIALSERNIIEIKNNSKNSEIISKNKRYLVIKYICYFAIGSLFLFFSWYYLSSFCAIYKNSQTFLIINTIISIVISFIYPIITNLMPAVFRIISLNDEKKEFSFRISQIIQII